MPKTTRPTRRRRLRQTLPRNSIPPPPFADLIRKFPCSARIFAVWENKKFRELADYIFWGAATTLVSFLVYAAATRGVGLAVVPATIIAWCVAVLFAFFTNKFWVFDSKSIAPLVVLRELCAFVAARLTSGGIELFMMWFFVDILGVNDWLTKVAATIVVNVANYVFSLLFVFKKKGKNHGN